MKKDPPIRKVTVTKESDAKKKNLCSDCALTKTIINHIIESPYTLKGHPQSKNIFC